MTPEQIAKLREVLTRCAERFREYERSHLGQAQHVRETARATRTKSAVERAEPEAIKREQKAARNREMAEMCEAALPDLLSAIESNPDERAIIVEITEFAKHIKTRRIKHMSCDEYFYWADAVDEALTRIVAMAPPDATERTEHLTKGGENG